ncbi:MAG: hypothetical protein HKM28_03290 [Flavobacteriaceae bacterium]|nr:hypothetical protein [Flavobacteriaceae bacterium]
MKKTLLLGAIAISFMTQCTDEKDPYLITNDSIGNLDKSNRMRQVDSLFAQDSIVKLSPIQDAIGTQGEVEIYDKAGEKLLLLSPDDEMDPNSRIYNIQIFDERFKTDNGLNRNSTFGELKSNYTISGIETGINTVVVFLENSNLYITIDKRELPENLRYDPNIDIEVSQIPDEARFKYFMLGWDQTE